MSPGRLYEYRCEPSATLSESWHRYLQECGIAKELEGVCTLTMLGSSAEFMVVVGRQAAGGCRMKETGCVLDNATGFQNQNLV